MADQTRKRCPVGFHKDRKTKDCKPLEPCFHHEEQRIYQNFIRTLEELDRQDITEPHGTKPKLPSGLTQRATGALPLKLLPVAHMRRNQIGQGTDNTAYSVNTRKICADKKTFPKYVARITRVPLPDRPYEEDRVSLRIYKNQIADLKRSAQLMQIMSSDKVSPKLFDLIVQPDRTIVVVMEQFPYDLHTYLHHIRAGQYEGDEHKIHILQQIMDQSLAIIQKIAARNMFCLDVKPGNAVIRDTTPKPKKQRASKNRPVVQEPLPRTTVEVRFIDFDERCFKKPITKSNAMKDLEMRERVDHKTVAAWLMYILFAKHLVTGHSTFFLQRRGVPRPVYIKIARIISELPDYLNVLNHYGFIPNTYKRGDRLMPICQQLRDQFLEPL